MIKTTLTVFLALCIHLEIFAQTAVWQWSVPVKTIISNETKDHPQAFLWVPENCKHIKGVVFGQHNMLEEGILESPAFRKKMTKLGFAEIWVSPAIDMVFDFNKDAGKVFNDIMKTLAESSGYDELNFAPIVPIGHSAAASFPWNFAAWNPDRTLAIISVKGDAPQTNLTGSGRPNPDWGKRNFDGVPGMMVMGEYEWWEDRLAPGFKYLTKHPNTPITWYADAGHSHFDYSDELVDYLASYIEKAAAYRLPKKYPRYGKVGLKPIDLKDGWLMDRWRNDQLLTAEAAPFNEYKGDRSVSSWCFDKDMVNQTIKRYDAQRGKQKQFIGFKQNGEWLKPQKTHANFHLKFSPEEDGITFHIESVFTDSSRIHISADHGKNKLALNRICGPVKKLNDTTFRVDFQGIGFSPRRSTEIWLLASSSADKKHKAVEQQAVLNFPLFNKEGRVQKITFPEIANQNVKAKSVLLTAVSDAGLPVHYYVKEGPAILDRNKIVFTKIPPKAKFPVKVTVVAWQYGTTIGSKTQSAEPVERSFYLEKKIK
ncbi:MAG TPA: hypothetical protein VL125_04690 [Pelobium sp.]|nr:hypothetical protein [Pelobium sp.]